MEQQQPPDDARLPLVHHAEDAGGREHFMGWAGKLLAYEKGKSKMKAKIYSDAAYEHLPIKSSGTYAIHNLIRLV